MVPNLKKFENKISLPYPATQLTNTLENMLYLYLKLTLPNMDSSHEDILQPINEMNSQMTLE